MIEFTVSIPENNDPSSTTVTLINNELIMTLKTGQSFLITIKEIPYDV